MQIHIYWMNIIKWFLSSALKACTFILHSLSMFQTKQDSKYRFRFFSFILIILAKCFLSLPALGSGDRQDDLRLKVMEEGLVRSLVAIRQLIPDGISPDCFISHVCMPEDHHDTLWTNRLEFYLRVSGVRTIYDLRDLRGSDDIETFINQIKTSSFVMSLFCPSYRENYDRRTWIYREAQLITVRYEEERARSANSRFHIPVLLAGTLSDSVPAECLSADLFHLVGETIGECKTDWEKCFNFIFKVLKNNFFPNLFGRGAVHENAFREIEERFDFRKGKVPRLFSLTTFNSPNGFFPQSLIAYGAFLDRTDETGVSYLDKIFEELFINEDRASGFSTTTLCATGMGGVGKTTLAIEYAHKYGPFYQLVYWIDASSRETLKRSCFALLSFLKAPIPSEESLEDEEYLFELMELVNQHLPLIGKACLVMDNIEDSSLVSHFHPHESHIIYTSRNQEGWSRKVDIGVFKLEESLSFLQRMTGVDPIYESEAILLAEELEHLPLALAQAVAYIKQQGFTSYKPYLDQFKTQQLQLLEKKQIQASLNKREAIVYSTWNITMQRMSPFAQHLMSLFAYLAPTDIPLAIFNKMVFSSDAINELATYSMIKKEAYSLSVHRVVQLVTRLQLADCTRSHTVPPINALLECLSIYWEELESQLGTLSPEGLFGLYQQDSNLTTHLEKLSEHTNEFSLESGFNETQLIDFKIANLGMLQALRDSLFTLRDDIISRQPDPKEVITVLRESLEERGVVLAERDYEQLAVLVPQIIPAEQDHIDLTEIVSQIRYEAREAFGEMVKVLTAETDAGCFKPILQNLSRLKPEEYPEFINICKRLISLPMNSNYCLLVISALVPMSAKARREFVGMILPFLSEEMGEEQAVVIRCFAEIPRKKRKAFVTMLSNILRANMNVDHYSFVITTLSESDIPNFKEFGDLISPLLTPGVNGDDGSRIIASVAQCSSDQRSQFVEFAVPYFVPNSSGHTQAWMASALFDVKPKHRPRFVENVKVLISPEMDENERWYVANAFSGVSPKHWERFVTEVGKLYTPATSPDNQTWIIDTFSKLSPEEYEDFVKIVSPFFAPDLENDHRAVIVKTFGEMATMGDRVEVGTMVIPLVKTDMDGYQRSNFIIAVNKGEKTQRESLTKVIDILSAWKMEKNDFFLIMLRFYDIPVDRKYYLATKTVYLRNLEEREESTLLEEERWLKRIVSSIPSDRGRDLVDLVRCSMGLPGFDETGVSDAMEGSTVYVHTSHPDAASMQINQHVFSLVK